MRGFRPRFAFPGLHGAWLRFRAASPLLRYWSRHPVAWLAIMLFAGIGYELVADDLERFRQAKTGMGAVFSLAIHSLVILALAGACFLNLGKMFRSSFSAPNAQKAKNQSQGLHRDLAARAKATREARQLTQILLPGATFAEKADRPLGQNREIGAKKNAYSNNPRAAKGRRL